MSLGHMPKWYQRVYNTVAAVGAAYIVLFFAIRPLDNELSPIPFLFTLLLSVALIWSAWVRLFGPGKSQDGDRQANLSEYN